MEACELVTVVIPAHNEERSLDACLASVRAQTHRDLQVLVVDGASTDGTADIVRTHMAEDDRVELLHNERLNIPSSLNVGLRCARGTWLVRVDAHATIPEDYVETAVARLREDHWGGVGGRKDGVGVTPAGRAIAVAMSSRLAVGNSTYHHGTQPQEVDHLAFGAYPVAVARELGGWDERLTANEDYEFDYRVRLSGRRLLFDPAMAIDWHCRQALPDLFRQYRRYGSGKVDVALLHPESLSPRHVAPPLFVVYLAAALLGAARHPRRSVAMTAPYVAALAIETVRQAPRLEQRGEQLRVPAAVAAMHIGWGLGFWSGLGRRLLTRSGRENLVRRAGGATGRSRVP